MRSTYLDYMRRVLDGESGRQDASLGKVMRQSRSVTLDRMTITNACNLMGGENVGGFNDPALDSDGDSSGASSTRSAAPEVAASEEDGGDGDPDSDRRPKRRNATPLPSAQLLRPKAACALLGIGRTKLWQLSERDPRFPRKIVLGPRCVGWRIDALNGYLRTLEQEG